MAAALGVLAVTSGGSRPCCVHQSRYSAPAQKRAGAGGVSGGSGDEGGPAPVTAAPRDGPACKYGLVDAGCGGDSGGFGTDGGIFCTPGSAAAPPHARRARTDGTGSASAGPSFSGAGGVWADERTAARSEIARASAMVFFMGASCPSEALGVRGPGRGPGPARRCYRTYPSCTQSPHPR